MRLLAERMVELDYAEAVSYETVAAATQKNELKPPRRKMGWIPPKTSADFGYHMEEVLEIYQRPYDEGRPVVCLDETFKQLIGEVREPLPVRPGHMERYDNVYVRNGVASLFLAFEPVVGWRERTRVLSSANFIRPSTGDSALVLIPQNISFASSGRRRFIICR